MEFFTYLTAGNKSAVLIGLAVLALVLFYLYHRFASSTDNGTDSSKSVRAPGSAGKVLEYKDEYTDELRRATLLLDGGQTTVEFHGISDVEIDTGFYPEITLEHTTGLTTNLSLGAYDLLISLGEPKTCWFHEASLIRVWAHGKLVYSESLADVELCEGYLTGYKSDGSDVCLAFGSGLTLCVEEI
jgi:hypothetical protein